MRSPISDKPRISSDGADGCQSIHGGSSLGGSKRITEPGSGRKQSKKNESPTEDETVIKIEES